MKYSQRVHTRGGGEATRIIRRRTSRSRGPSVAPRADRAPVRRPCVVACGAPDPLRRRPDPPAPRRHPRRRRRSRLRGASLPDALPVRRSFGGSGHHPQCQLPGSHRRGSRGLGLRIDDARQRLGLSWRVARDRARRDDRARRRDVPRHGRMRRDRASHRSVPRARAGIPPLGRGGHTRARPARAHPEAVHARRRQRLRRRAARRVWQGVRGEQLRHVRIHVHAARSVARPRRGVHGRVPRSLRAGVAAAAHAGVPLRRRERSARVRGRPATGR